MRTQHAYREQDYKREDENAVIPRPTKCYVMSELVIETAAAHGLRCERISFPSWDFVIVKVWATKAQYKAAQYEWLQKMIATQKQPQLNKGDVMPPCEGKPRASHSAAPAMQGATNKIELDLFG